jgi:hypothetical protein
LYDNSASLRLQASHFKRRFNAYPHGSNLQNGPNQGVPSEKLSNKAESFLLICAIQGYPITLSIPPLFQSWETFFDLGNISLLAGVLQIIAFIRKENSNRFL